MKLRIKLRMFNPITPTHMRDYGIRPATWRDWNFWHCWGLSLNGRGKNGRLNYDKRSTVLYFSVAFGFGLFVFDLWRKP